MTEAIVIALITNATVIIVAAIQALFHRKHEGVSQETLTEVKKLSGNGKVHD